MWSKFSIDCPWFLFVARCRCVVVAVVRCHSIFWGKGNDVWGMSGHVLQFISQTGSFSWRKDQHPPSVLHWKMRKAAVCSGISWRGGFRTAACSNAWVSPSTVAFSSNAIPPQTMPQSNDRCRMNKSVMLWSLALLRKYFRYFFEFERNVENFSLVCLFLLRTPLYYHLCSVPTVGDGFLGNLRKCNLGDMLLLPPWSGPSVRQGGFVEVFNQRCTHHLFGVQWHTNIGLELPTKNDICRPCAKVFKKFKVNDVIIISPISRCPAIIGHSHPICCGCKPLNQRASPWSSRC